MRLLAKGLVLSLTLAAAFLLTACLEDDPNAPNLIGNLGWTEMKPQTVGPSPDQIADQAASAIALVGALEQVDQADSLAEQGLANHDVTAIDKAIAILPRDEWFREVKVAELVAKGKNAEAVQAASELRAVLQGAPSSLTVDKGRDRDYYRGLLRALNASIKARPGDTLPDERKRLLAQFCYTLADFKSEFGEQEALPYTQHLPGAC